MDGARKPPHLARIAIALRAFLLPERRDQAAGKGTAMKMPSSNTVIAGALATIAGMYVYEKFVRQYV